ncbi:hypothetical protein G9A89_009149 [Geosiphon pyriformis]|nr:hypothetical protein G9A89_009149 [Geosiphon pyriformis]
MDICRPICHRPLSRVESDHLGATANIASACNDAPSASMLVYTDIRKPLSRVGSDHLGATANVASACNDAPSAILVWLLMGILNVRMDICRPICHRPLSRVGSDHLGATANVVSACNDAPSASMLVYTDIRKSSFDS